MIGILSNNVAVKPKTVNTIQLHLCKTISLLTPVIPFPFFYKDLDLISCHLLRSTTRREITPEWHNDRLYWFMEILRSS